MFTVFALPEGLEELMLCIGLFVVISLTIWLLELIWCAKCNPEHVFARRVLFWELGVVVAILASYYFGGVCVILPLLFLLVFLIMWYLTIKLSREK